MTEKYGFVYIWRDRKHNRYYIGCHWGYEDDGYICSSKWMRKSHWRRPQDFKRRILETNIQDRSQMYEREQVWLNLIDETEIKPNTTEPKYYNLCLSSKKPWHQYPDKVKTIGQKISERKKGKKTGPRPQYVKDAISKANTGKKRTLEQIERNRQSLIGRTSPRKGVTLSEETCSKISESLSGHIQSEETIQKRCESLKKKWAEKSEEEKKVVGQNISKSLARKWIVIDPEENEIEVENLKKFCAENGLSNTNITKNSGSRGWRAACAV